MAKALSTWTLSEETMEQSYLHAAHSPAPDGQNTHSCCYGPRDVGVVCACSAIIVTDTISYLVKLIMNKMSPCTRGASEPPNMLHEGRRSTCYANIDVSLFYIYSQDNRGNQSTTWQHVVAMGTRPLDLQPQEASLM